MPVILVNLHSVQSSPATAADDDGGAVGVEFSASSVADSSTDVDRVRTAINQLTISNDQLLLLQLLPVIRYDAAAHHPHHFIAHCTQTLSPTDHVTNTSSRD